MILDVTPHGITIIPIMDIIKPIIDNKIIIFSIQFVVIELKQHIIFCNIFIICYIVLIFSFIRDY